jgi:hypothetical protein
MYKWLHFTENTFGIKFNIHSSNKVSLDELRHVWIYSPDDALIDQNIPSFIITVFSVKRNQVVPVIVLPTKFDLMPSSSPMNNDFFYLLGIN